MFARVTFGFDPWPLSTICPPAPDEDPAGTVKMLLASAVATALICAWVAVMAPVMALRVFLRTPLMRRMCAAPWDIPSLSGGFVVTRSLT